MDDTISRQEAIDVFPEDNLPWDTFEGYIAPHLVRKILEQLPSAQPERKKGKWINGVCDQCGSHAPYWAMASTYYRSSFCPNCGADMRGEQNDTNRMDNQP